MKNKIYLLYTCDVWKSRNSFSLYWAGTSKEILKKALVNGIQNEDFYFEKEEYNSKSQLSLLRDAINSGFPIPYVDSHLINAHIDVIDNNDFT